MYEITQNNLTKKSFIELGITSFSGYALFRRKMDQIKYVMLPRIDDKVKEVKPQPWYKERLREKYITKKPNNKEKLLDAKQWVFVKDGLDDFRDGLPPPHDDLLLKVYELDAIF